LGLVSPSAGVGSAPILHYRVCDVVGHGEAAVAHARREELRQGADFC
jgi:hypothetical protein